MSLRIPSSSRSPDHDPHRTIYYLGNPLGRFAGLKHRQLARQVGVIITTGEFEGPLISKNQSTLRRSKSTIFQIHSWSCSQRAESIPNFPSTHQDSSFESASISSQSPIRLLLPRPCSCIAVSQIKSPIELKSDEGAIRFEIKEALAAISSDSPSHHLFSSYPLSMCWSCRKFHLPGTCTKTGSMPSATAWTRESYWESNMCTFANHTGRCTRKRTQVQLLQPCRVPRLHRLRPH
jgi:hypothetical protein